MYKGAVNIVTEMLLGLGMFDQGLPMPFESHYDFMRRITKDLSKRSHYKKVYQLQQRGVVKISTKQGKRFLELTEKGELEVLLTKSFLEKPDKWDGKWRLITFDIPADRGSNRKRDQLRNLLKRQGFYMFQESVFIHPYPLSREAIDYLKRTGLIAFIRILRVEEIDDDSDLRKKFNVE